MKPRKNVMIVVAEDDPLFRHLLDRTLRKMHVEVRACSDGVEALDIVRQAGDVSLVIADLVMPNLDGRELARKVLEEHPDQRFLFISGYDPEGLEDEPWYRPTHRFLKKPFDLRDLMEIVREMVG